MPRDYEDRFLDPDNGWQDNQDEYGFRDHRDYGPGGTGAPDVGDGGVDNGHVDTPPDSDGSDQTGNSGNEPPELQPDGGGGDGGGTDDPGASTDDGTDDPPADGDEGGDEASPATPPPSGADAMPGVGDTTPPSADTPLLNADPLATDTRGPQLQNMSGRVGDTSVTTRGVTDNELVAHQMMALLNSNSEYMRQARMAGLESGGGLGGSMGMRAAQGAAYKAAAPIAAADAQAYRDAARDNMAALNQFALTNIQRQTQLELGQLQADTQIRTQAMANSMQMAVAQLNAMTQIEVANLDAATRIRTTELQGQIQGRLAELNFQYNSILNMEGHGYAMEQIALTGEYDFAKATAYNDAQRELSFIAAMAQSYQGTLDRIAELNGLEMDAAARKNAIDAIWEGHYKNVAWLEDLFGIDWDKVTGGDDGGETGG